MIVIVTVILTLLFWALAKFGIGLESKVNRYKKKANVYRLKFFAYCMAYWLLLVIVSETLEFNLTITLATIVLTLATIWIVRLIKAVLYEKD